jgi:hypothetical protein
MRASNIMRRTCLALKAKLPHLRQQTKSSRVTTMSLSLIFTYMSHTMQTETALNNQIGGDHYSKLKIQPMEYSMANGLDACQHTVIKYVTRFRDKGGLQDLHKAQHTLQMLIEFEKAKRE